MTAHRRENLGKPLENICKVAKSIATEFQDTVIIYPVHPNPIIKNIAEKILGNVANIFLTKPLDVEDMHNIMSKSYMVMTDSGGIQEEAPFWGIPVLVMRTETERPEAVKAGTVRVVGVEEQDIYESAKELLTNKETYRKMAHAINPYGDGHACERIVEEILRWKQNV